MEENLGNEKENERPLVRQKLLFFFSGESRVQRLPISQIENVFECFWRSPNFECFTYDFIPLTVSHLDDVVVPLVEDHADVSAITGKDDKRNDTLFFADLSNRRWKGTISHPLSLSFSLALLLRYCCSGREEGPLLVCLLMAF